MRDESLLVDGGAVLSMLQRLRENNQRPWDGQYVVVHPSKWRFLVIAGYQAGHLTWGQAFCELYNAGWRGRETNPSNRET